MIKLYTFLLIYFSSIGVGQRVQIEGEAEYNFSDNETLIEAKIKIIILSGNPHDQVNEEADLLDISRYCEGHVYGHTHAENFSKQSVMEKLMVEEGFSSENLIAIGDGAAEIKATKALGGLAVAICSDEENNGSGVIDENKLPILLDGGADCVIADYREPTALLNLLNGK